MGRLPGPSPRGTAHRRQAVLANSGVVGAQTLRSVPRGPSHPPCDRGASIAYRNALATPREGVQGQQTPADGDLQPNEREGWNIPQRELRQHAHKGRREERCQGLRNRDDTPVQSRRLTLQLTRDRSGQKGWASLADLGPQGRGRSGRTDMRTTTIHVGRRDCSRTSLPGQRRDDGIEESITRSRHRRPPRRLSYRSSVAGG
jgi:hypothetical protein